MNRTRTLAAGAALSLVWLAAACSGGADGAPAAGGPGGAPAAGAAGPGGAASSPMVTLASTDVLTLHPMALSESTPVTGNLVPVDQAELRARLEGDLVAVGVREGQHVRAGEVLARFEDSAQQSALRSAEAGVAAARTDVSTAQWTLDQTKSLYEQGAVAEQDLRGAEQQAAAARARLAAAVAAQRAAELTARDTRVTAPFDGVIDKRDVNAGEHVARGGALFTIVRNQVLELTASVPARRAQGVEPGQQVQFTADAAAFQGHVARVSPTIDPTTRSVTVYVEVPNPDGRIKGGTFATGRIVRRVIQGALAVPTSAVHQAPGTGQTFVYRVAGEVLDETPITLGAVDEAQEMVQVAAGLHDGDQVVIGNVGMLGKGMRVQVLGTESRTGMGAGNAPAPAADDPPAPAGANAAGAGAGRPRSAAGGSAPAGAGKKAAGTSAAGGAPRPASGPGHLAPERN